MDETDRSCFPSLTRRPAKIVPQSLPLRLQLHPQPHLIGYAVDPIVAKHQERRTAGTTGEYVIVDLHYLVAQDIRPRRGRCANMARMGAHAVLTLLACRTQVTAHTPLPLHPHAPEYRQCAGRALEVPLKGAELLCRSV